MFTKHARKSRAHARATPPAGQASAPENSPRNPASTLTVLTLAAALSLAAGPVMATSGGQGAYLADLWTEAKSRRIPRDLFEQAFAGFKIIPKVIESSTTQPETLATVQNYIEKRVNTKRIASGRAKSIEWNNALARIEEAYGVPAEILVSIWGIETNYGGFMGGSNVLHALATLAHENYRGAYFRRELMTALEIVRDGHVRSDRMVGSWAGAMGQTQFMPSSFVNYAVDFEGDGRADIWSSVPDALASSANYLSKSGWRHGEAWGYEVRLPKTFDYASAWAARRMTMQEWQRLGAIRVDGKAFPRPGDSARFYLPAGGRGPAFLLLRNFDVIKRYNNSDSYALSVAHLADRVSGGASFTAAWPADIAPLSQVERRELQKLLSERGYDVGEIDGRIGAKSRLALIRYQKSEGRLADGFPTKQILQSLRRSPAGRKDGETP